MSRPIYTNNTDEFKQPIFHPSFFETTIADSPKDTRIVMELDRERLKKLNTDNLNDLTSPGNYGMVDKNNDELSKSNTRFMSKILFEESLLSFLYFSKKNVENIQNVIKYKVYQKTNKVVDSQNTSELLIIMRSIYLEYSSHPPILNDKMPYDTKVQVIKMYTDEVERLNQMVIDYVYPNVLSGLQQYISYLRDASSLPYQQNQPDSSDNVQGQRQYRSITQVLLGTDL
jgi:hypothetical protein